MTSNRAKSFRSVCAFFMYLSQRIKTFPRTGRPPSAPTYHLRFAATIPGRPPSTPTRHLGFRHHTGRPPSTPTRHLVFSPSYGSTTVDPYTSFGFFAIIRADHRRPLHVIWFFSPSYGSTTVGPYTSFGFFAIIPGRPPSTPAKALP